MASSATTTRAREQLVSAGTTISAQRAQDWALDLYADADDILQLRLQTIMRLSLSRLWFATPELAAILDAIEATACSC